MKVFHVNAVTSVTLNLVLHVVGNASEKRVQHAELAERRVTKHVLDKLFNQSCQTLSIVVFLKFYFLKC